MVAFRVERAGFLAAAALLYACARRDSPNPVAPHLAEAPAESETPAEETSSEPEVDAGAPEAATADIELSPELKTCIKGVLAQRVPKTPTCDDDKSKKPVKCPHPQPNDACPECEATIVALRARPAETFFNCWKRSGAVCFETIEEPRQQACLRQAVNGVCAVTDAAMAMCAQLKCSCDSAERFDLDLCEKFVSALEAERAAYYLSAPVLPCNPRDMFFSIGPEFE